VIGDQTIYHHLFVDRHVITAQNKEDAEHMTKKLMEYWRWGVNVNILKPEYLGVGSDIQNMKREDNIKINGTTAFNCLGSIFTNSSECTHEVFNTIEPARRAT
jgi:hypothetical protein